MVWIEATAERAVTIRAPRGKVLSFMERVETSGPLFPGVRRVEVLGEGRFRWLLEERRTLGTSFTGDYVARYTTRSDREITWDTESGNMKTRGSWRLEGADGAVRLVARVTTTLDAPVPRILKRPAELFAERETGSGLEVQLERVKSAIE